MINKVPARKAGEVPESAKKPKSTEPGQPLKQPDDDPSPSPQKPELAARQPDYSGLSQTSKTSDVSHVEVEIVDETKNGSGGDNPPYKRLRIPQDQIPIVLGLEPKPATKQRWWKWLFTPIGPKAAQDNPGRDSRAAQDKQPS